MKIRRVILALFVGITVVLVIYALTSVVRHARTEVVRVECEKHLRNLARAIWEYQDKYDHFPAATIRAKEDQPPHSWRVALLPFLGRQDLYDAYHFDEPWNGPNNSRLTEQMPDVFGCPGDSGKPKGNTNYVAIVGSQTVWPGPYAIKRSDIIDGQSVTILLVEIDHSDIPWLEPRDITFRDLIPLNSDKVGARYSSPHPEVVNLALCDGSIRGVKKSIDRKVLMSALTPAGGRPFRGKWLPGEEPTLDATFPPEIEASRLSRTIVTPILDDHLDSTRNTLYCATFQLAWQDFRATLKTPPEVEGDGGLAAALNRAQFPREALSADTHVARAGLVRDGIVEKIKTDMAQRFPSVTPSLRSAKKSDIIAYAFLQKNLPFDVRFDVLSNPLVFHATGGDTSVRSFGFTELEKASGSVDELNRQVTVLHYRSDDEFALRLKPQGDEIVLAKIPPSPTLKETLADVRKRIGDHSQSATGRQLEKKDSLAVPKIAFNILRDYTELIDKRIVNLSDAGFTEARQSMRFLLNESGAWIESEVEFGGWLNGHDKPPEPPKPRHFVFDKPFLLYVQEPKAAAPYLVMWVANLEIMEKTP